LKFDLDQGNLYLNTLKKFFWVDNDEGEILKLTGNFKRKIIEEIYE
jgi:hypothetical protein